HTDQVFFPLFFAIPIALAVHGFRGNAHWASLLAGVTAYLALYFNFALALVIPFLLGSALMSILDARESRAKQCKAVSFHCLLALAGFMVLWFSFQIAFG